MLRAALLLLGILVAFVVTARLPERHPARRRATDVEVRVGRLKRKPVDIISMTSDFNPDGSSHYSYETEDGTKVEQVGQVRDFGEGVKGYVVHGAYEFIGPDGRKYRVTYTADENGFQPKGAHLPVAPPFPGAQHSGPRTGPPGKYRGGEGGGREAAPGREDDHVDYDDVEDVIDAK